jgi:N6-L-threonylcarbamoyladenine synthase/protein kinase Bud32
MPVFGQILGIEGTAWNLSAALFDQDLISLVSRPYSPALGGIHPREAAQHHASVMKELISLVLKEPDKITGIAFSQGPGLGPCLRTVATAARSLALALDVPLVGVNHCIAHIEIGRFATGCRDPIILYASGANTQVIGYLNSRYRQCTRQVCPVQGSSSSWRSNHRGSGKTRPVHRSAIYCQGNGSRFFRPCFSSERR